MSGMASALPSAQSCGAPGTGTSAGTAWPLTTVERVWQPGIASRASSSKRPAASGDGDCQGYVSLFWLPMDDA